MDEREKVASDHFSLFFFILFIPFSFFNLLLLFYFILFIILLFFCEPTFQPVFRLVHAWAGSGLDKPCLSRTCGPGRRMGERIGLGMHCARESSLQHARARHATCAHGFPRSSHTQLCMQRKIIVPPLTSPPLYLLRRVGITNGSSRVPPFAWGATSVKLDFHQRITCGKMTVLPFRHY